MMDRAHELTDAMIRRTEQRLRREYSRAAREIEEKCNDYFRRFEIKDKKWRKWVEQGKKTESEYKKWRTGQMAVGRRWNELKANVAKDMLNTNQIARQIIDGSRPDIYALNHAYGTYQVEQSGINTSYTLYNHEAVEKILRDNPDMLPPPGKKVSKKISDGIAKRWSRQKMQSVITQSIIQGESIPQMAKRLAESVADSDYKAAVRNARTMATGAQNAGRYDAYRRATAMGIDLTIEWASTLDNRTRHAHREMHGQRTTIDEPFYTPDGYTILYPADCTETSTAPQEHIYNCRCTLLAWVQGFEGDTQIDSDKMTMPFEDWVDEQEGSEEFQDILHQDDVSEAIKMRYARKYKYG